VKGTQYRSFETTADTVDQPQQQTFHTAKRWLFSWKVVLRGLSNCRWSTGTAEQNSSHKCMHFGETTITVIWTPALCCQELYFLKMLAFF